MPINDDKRITFYEITPVWRGDLKQQDFNAALHAANLDEDLFPRNPNELDYLYRAVEHIAPRGSRVTKFAAKEENCLGGVAFVQENKDKLDISQFANNEAYQTNLSAKLYRHGTGRRLDFTPFNHPAISIIESQYEYQREMYKTSQDLSAWFTTSILPVTRAIRKRPQGGVYYVPKSRIEPVLQIQKALSQVSVSAPYAKDPTTGRELRHVVNGGFIAIEPRTTSDAATIELILEGIISDVDSTLLETMNRLQKNIGVKALHTQRGNVIELESKLSQFETICGFNLEQLRKRIGAVQTAIMYAEAQTEDALTRNFDD